MQQTDQYKLNLIDMDDNFSPDPMNKNMEKVEEALSAEAGRRAALDSRVTVLEGHKIAIGTYTGTSARQTIQVGFRPKAVFIQKIMVSGDCFLATALGGSAAMADDGFTLTTTGNPNYQDIRYAYVAIK